VVVPGWKNHDSFQYVGLSILSAASPPAKELDQPLFLSIITRALLAIAAGSPQAPLRPCELSKYDNLDNLLSPSTSHPQCLWKTEFITTNTSGARHRN
jgi:hypothetical protein